MGYTVGQTLLYVPCNQREAPREVVIEKVGRKWLALSNWHRADIETLQVDGRGCSSPGRCYLSRDDYERQVAISKEWRALRLAMDRRYTPIDGVTVERIRQARELLGFVK